MRNTSDYWEFIPIGKQNRMTYRELSVAWGINKRSVRLVLHRLSEYDNGDGFVLIRSSKLRGFYRTDDPAEIEAYRREVVSRATKTFAPLRKINRVLGENEGQMAIKF